MLQNNPRIEFHSAALTVFFFIECLLHDILTSGKSDLVGTAALRLAVELGKLDAAKKLLAAELEDIATSGSEADLNDFIKDIRALVIKKHPGIDWQRALFSEP
jgi:hypothetical protein